MSAVRIASRSDFWKLTDVAFERHRPALVQQAAACIASPHDARSMTWLVQDPATQQGGSSNSRMQRELRVAPDLRRAVATRLRQLDVAEVGESYARVIGQFAETFAFARPRTPAQEDIDSAMKAFAPIESAHTQAMATESLHGQAAFTTIDGGPVVAELLQHPDGMRWLMLALPKIKDAANIMGGFKTAAGVPERYTVDDVRDASSGLRKAEDITGSRKAHELARAHTIVQLLAEPTIHNAMVDAFAAQTRVFDMKARSSLEGMTMVNVIDAVRDVDTRRVAQEFVEAFDLDSRLEARDTLQLLAPQFPGSNLEPMR